MKRLLLRLWCHATFLFGIGIGSALTAQTDIPFYGPLYDSSGVATLHVLMAPDSADAMLYGDVAYAASNLFPADFFLYDPAGNPLDTVYNIGVRLRGNTSLNSPKKSFKLDLNEFVVGQKLYDVEKINVNANQNDPSLFRAALSWRMIRELGLPGTRTSFVRMEINEEYMGAYVNTEHMDEEWVEEYYDSDGGNLYKCLWPADLMYLGSDPDEYKLVVNGRRPYDLQTNQMEDDYADLAHFIDVLNNTSESDFPCAIEEVFNVADYLQTQALEVLVGHWDNYSVNKNNYFLYHNPRTGLMEFISYDLDNTWGINWIGGVDWSSVSPYDFVGDDRPLFTRLMAVDEYRSWYTHFLRQISMDLFNLNAVTAWVEDWQAMLASHVQTDTYFPMPFGFAYEDWASADVEAAGGHVEYGLYDWLDARSTSLLNQLDPDEPILVVHEIEDNGPVLDTLRIRAIVNASDADPEVVAWVDAGSGPVAYPMADDGMSGDRAAGDGTFGVKIGIPWGWTEVHYTVEAIAGNLSREVPCEPRQVAVGMVPGDLVFNELLASNSGVIFDEFLEFDDWVEIYNSGPSAVWLGNLYLTDNLNTPDKYAFPDLILEPGDWHMVWTDNDPEQGDNHAGFTLSAGGDDVALFRLEDDGDWTLLRHVSFGESDNNVSLGRLTDGAPNWVWFATPTPGYSNNGAIVLGVTPGEHSEEVLQAWPNPASGSFLQLNRNVNGILFDAAGRPVQRIQNSAVLDLGGLGDGTYLLRTDSGDVVRFLRIQRGGW
ncbi:MAG: CotH kinase family protein [Flavobacteriales bacterium]